MDNELIDIPIDYDEIKLEQQDSNIQESQEISSQIIQSTQQSPQKSLANSQIRYSQKISFHLSEQVSSSVLQLYENIQYTLYSQIEDKPSSTVYRKYTHFEWLNAALKRELPGLIVPAVPPKNMLAKINLAERTQCIREKRFRQLDEFLQKVIQNSKLQTCPKFQIFLTASPEIMQQELQEMLQYHSYAKQMGTALLSAGSKAYDIAKGSITYFSSFIYTQQPIQKQIQFPDLEIIQDIKEFFESWEDLLIEEQKKVRKIFEYYNSIVNIKLEQNEETRRIISAMRDLNVEELDKCIKKQSASVYLNENLLNEIRNNVLFKLELCCFDIDEAINIIKVRNDLINEIQQQIKIHNQSESLNEKLQLKEEIIRNQKILKTLESNFQVDVKSFAIWLNKYLQQLIQTYNEQFQKLYSEQNKNWND